MGALQTKSGKKKKLKSIANLEQSYSCYSNSDPDTQLQLRKYLIQACSEGSCDDVTNLLQLGVPVDSSVSYAEFYECPHGINSEINTLFSLLPEEIHTDYANVASEQLRQKRVRVLEVLIEYGMDINFKDSNGETLLHKFCNVALAVDFSVFKEIVQLGCDIHCVDISGNSLLHCCCSEEKLYNKKHMLKYLLENGLDPNLQNSAGETAIHLSVKCCNDAHIKLLMEYNADINVQTFPGRKTPLHLAINPDHEETGYSDGHLDGNPRITTIRTLLSYEPNINLLDNRRISAFGEALNQKIFVPYSHNELCQEFINCGADLSAGDSNRNTILHLCYKCYLASPGDRKEYASLRAHADVEKYVNCGANVNKKNRSFFYAVEYCIKYFNLTKIQDEIPLLCKSLRYHIEAGLVVTRFKHVNKEKLQIIYSIVKNKELETKSWDELVQAMTISGFKFHEEQEMPLLSLKRLCANYIRGSFRPNAIVGLSKLDLPASIKTYIMLKQIF